MRLILNCLLVISFLSTVNLLHSQIQFELIGEFNPCTPGCYTYIIESEEPGFELNVWNLFEPAPNAHSIDYIWTQEEVGFVICYELPGTYEFNYFVYFDQEYQDSFTVEVGYSTPVTIQELEPCEVDDFVACKGSTKTYFIEEVFDSIGTVFGFWEVFGADSYFTNPDGSVTVTWGQQNFGSLYYGLENPGSCFTETEQRVELIDNPMAEFAIENAKPKFCQGEEVFLLNNSLNGSSFYWDFGDGTTSQDVQPVKAYENPGNYVISLIAEGACGCTDVYALEVIIDDLWMPQIDCKGTICENTTVTYTSIEDCGTFNWQISGNGVIIEGGSNNDNFITVEWGNGPVGIIDLEVNSCANEMCPTPAQYIIPIVTDNAPITGNLTPCLGATEVYSVTDFGASDYAWVVNGGTILSNGNDNSIMVQWDNATNGTIDVSYNNCYLECGGSSMTSATITEAFSIDGQSKICNTDELIIKAIEVGSGNPAVVIWSLVDSDYLIIDSQQGTDQFTYKNASLKGKYYLIGTSDFYCNQSDTLALFFTPSSPLPLSIEGETAICVGNDYAYTALSDLINPTFKWIINDGGTSTELTGETIIYNWTSAGPYEIKTAQKDNNGDWCYSEYISMPLQEVTDLSFSGNLAPCQDETSIYTATSYEGLNYEWSIIPSSAGTVISEQGNNTVEIQWVISGNHTIQLDACGKTDQIAVVVSPKPTISLDYEERICYNVTTETKILEPFTNYNWTNESGNTLSTSPNPDLGPGTYLVKVVDDKGCQNQENFTINELPKPEINISTPDSTGVCVAEGPGYPTLYAVTAEQGYDYEWYESNTSLGAMDIKFLTSDLGDYKVLVTDQNGCTAFSNTLRVFNFCGGCSGGTGTPTTCDYPQDCESDTGEVKFSFTEGPNCRTFSFKNESVNIKPGTLSWNFEDFKSGAQNISTEDNPTHTFTDAGYYVVSVIAEVEDKNNPGEFCRQWKAELVTVPIKAYFASISACPGAPVAFIDRSTFLPEFPIVSYEWNFGDPTSSDNTSTDANPSHTYALSGTYTTQLVISNGTCTDTITRDVIVHDLPNATIELTDSKCEDIAGLFNLIPGDSLAKATWNFDDPLSLDKNTSSVFPTYHTYENAGIYTVSSTMENIYGCIATTNAPFEIFENNLAGDIESTEGSIICENTSTTLSVSSTDAITWFWQDSSASSTLAINQAGIYQVTIADANLCTYAPDAFKLEVQPAPKVGIRIETFVDEESIILDGIEVQVCEGENVRIMSDQTPDYSYIWNNGINTSTLVFSADNNNLLAAGLNEFTVTVIDNNTGCTYTSIPVKIDVLPNPSNLTIVADQAGTLCGGENHNLSVVNPLAGVDYYWNTGKKSTTLETTGGGVFWVRGINANGCTTISNEIIVRDGPDMDNVPTGCFTRCNPDTICMPSIPNAVQYQWYFEGVAVDPSQNGDIPELIALNSGSYQLEATDNFGCTNTSDPLVLTLQDAIGELTGSLYVDVDGDDLIGAGDTLKSGVTIVLSNGWTTTTDDNGAFKFINLPGGNYSITVDTTGLGGFIDVFDGVSFDVVTCDDEINADLLIQKNCEPMRLADRSEHLCSGDEIIIEGTAYSSEGEFIIYKANSNGCLDSFNLMITKSREVTLDLTSETACESSDNGQIICEIPVGSGQFTYDLNNGESSNSNGEFMNVPSGNHEVSVFDENNCMVANESIEVALTESITYEIAQTEWNCEEAKYGPSIEILTGNEDDIEVKWSNGGQGLEGTYYEPGWHSVTVSNDCESIEEEFFVERTYQEVNIDLPNVFSPNDDGVNEEFRIALDQLEAPKVLSFVISDRMGRVIYNYSYNPAKTPTWNGRLLNGDNLPVGVYFYYIEMEHDVCGYMRRETLTGDVTIIR